MPEFYYDEDQSHVSCCQYENFDYLWSITFLCLLVKHWKEFIARCKDWVHKNSSEICDRLVRPKIFCLTGVRALSDLSKGALVFPFHLANTRLRL